jgi:excisionase family DNA binding protein
VNIELSDLPTLCTIDEAANALRLSTRAVRRLLATGRLRAAKLAIGGSSKLLVPRVELERLVRESVV